MIGTSNTEKLGVIFKGFLFISFTAPLTCKRSDEGTLSNLDPLIGIKLAFMSSNDRETDQPGID
jgi:hypothetical protein